MRFSLHSHLLNILALGQGRTKYSLLQFLPVARRSHSHWREFQDLILGGYLTPWADNPNSPCHRTTTQCCQRTCSTLTGTLLPQPGPVLHAGLSGNQEVSRNPKIIQWCPEIETGKVFNSNFSPFYQNFPIFHLPKLIFPPFLPLSFPHFPHFHSPG